MTRIGKKRRVPFSDSDYRTTLATGQQTFACFAHTHTCLKPWRSDFFKTQFSSIPNDSTWFQADFPASQPSFKNSSKPTASKLQKCPPQQNTQKHTTSSPENWSMAPLKAGVYRSSQPNLNQKLGHNMSTWSLNFQETPGRNANPFAIEVRTWTSTEEIRDNFNDRLCASHALPFHMSAQGTNYLQKWSSSPVPKGGLNC